MPTYEYECLKCGNTFELFQNISEEPVKKCPECKGKVKRLIGAGAGILFKGSGFYITDYKKNGKGGGSKTASSVTTAKENKTEAPKTETKVSSEKKGSDKWGKLKVTQVASASS